MLFGFLGFLKRFCRIHMKCVFYAFSGYKKKTYQTGPPGPGYWEPIILTFSLQVLRCCAGRSVTSESHDFSSPNQTLTLEAVGAATQSTRSCTSTVQWRGLGTNPQWEEYALLLDANLRRNFAFNPQCHTNKKALKIFPMCVSWIILPTWQAGRPGLAETPGSEHALHVILTCCWLSY